MSESSCWWGHGCGQGRPRKFSRGVGSKIVRGSVGDLSKDAETMNDETMFICLVQKVM